jgi:hypothetical protein
MRAPTVAKGKAKADNGSTPAPGPLAIRRVRLDDLHQDAANVRLHDRRNLDSIIASLKQFGQVEPLVVQKGTNKVIGGNGRLAAMREIGTVEADVVEVDADNLTATALGIALNRTASLAAWDDEALAATLRALQEEGFPTAAAGFDDAELDALLGGLAAADDGGYGGEPDDAEPLVADGPKVFADEQVVEAAFAHFRATGYPYRNLPAWECMRQVNRLAATEPEAMLRTVAAYQVPDTYHRHRFHAAAEGMRSPFDSFQDDASLRKAIRLALENNKDVETVLWMVNGTQACANFRPGFACKLYRQYCRPGAVVLDSSTGYGGRLVGFLAAGLAGTYIGIDPNRPTHEANLRMAADLGVADRVELHNLPAEDVPHDVVAGRCDFAFTSPPYFRKEHYSDDATQSWRRYPTGDAWRDGFLAPMLRLQFAALRPGSHAIVNIADVTLKGTTYPLVAWTRDAAVAAGFDYLRTDEFPMQRRFGTGQDEEVAVEPVLVFRKPGGSANGVVSPPDAPARPRSAAPPRRGSAPTAR